jgi:hypothetical protein
MLHAHRQVKYSTFPSAEDATAFSLRPEKEEIEREREGQDEWVSERETDDVREMCVYSTAQYSMIHPY